MSKRIVSGLMLTLLFIGMLTLAFKIQPVRAGETIYIRADGSIEPSTAPIQRDGDLYTLTDDIFSDTDGIMIERNNMTLDGAGYTVQGTMLSGSKGIDLSGRENVTVRDTQIKNFWSGIRLFDSSNSTISANKVTNNEYGIGLYGSSSKNTLRHNDASDNRYNLGVFTESVSGFIQDIDDSNTVNSKPVYYWVNRRDMAVPLDAGYVVLVNCTRITVKNLGLTNNIQGVALAFTTNSTITNNNLINNFDGIKFDHSSNNNLISGNNITANSHYGIRFYYRPSASAMSTNNVGTSKYGNQLSGPSCNNTIYGNNITNNGSGIRLDYPSNNTISANNVVNNSDEGIGLYGSSNNNTVSGNNIINNRYGMWFYSVHSNWIYHNNFIHNTPQVYPSFHGDSWDDDYPSGGNYWSDYTGVDADGDGIGDTPRGHDNYPLMGPISIFNAGTWDDTTYYINIISNSTLSGFYFNPDEGAFVRFGVSGEPETLGFCRVTIPNDLLWVEDGWTIYYGSVTKSYTAIQDENYTYLYFTYQHPYPGVTTYVEIVGTNVIEEERILLGSGLGWMRIEANESVHGGAELYKIGDEKIELVITCEGETHSRTWNIMSHREHKYGERYLCYSEEWRFLNVRLHEHRRWQFWHAVGKGVAAFGLIGNSPCGYHSGGGTHPTKVGLTQRFA